jgi:branched-chain amino acid transport system permease protein
MFYTAFVVMRLPLILAAVFGVLVAIVLGVVVERFVLRPLIGEHAISVIMVTIGLSAVLRAIIQIFFGTAVREQPPILPTGTIQVAGATVPLNRLIVIGVAAIVLFAFTAFFQKSRHGVAMRAVADDQQAALTMGISVKRVFSLAWILAAISALIAGVLLADLSAVEQGIAAFGLMVFPVVILGGLDSVPGTVVGGLVIGLLKQYVSGYADPGLAEVIPYIVLVAILIVRPYGIFGETRIERV